MKQIGYFFFRLYRSELITKDGKITLAGRVFIFLARIFLGPQIKEIVATLHYWIDQQPFRSSKRLFGLIDSIEYHNKEDSIQQNIIRGWIFDIYSPIESIYLWNNQSCIATGPVWENRDDVSGQFVAEPNAHKSGFEFITHGVVGEVDTLKCIARTIHGEMITGILNINKNAPQQLNPQKSKSADSNQRIREILILVGLEESSAFKREQANIISLVCRENNIEARIVFLNRSPSEVISTISADFPFSVVRSAEEFALLLRKYESILGFIVLHPDGLWYCDRLHKVDPGLLSKLTIVDDSISFIVGDNQKDFIRYHTRSSFCPVLVLPKKQCDYFRKINKFDNRKVIQSPEEFEADIIVNQYQEIIEYLNLIS